MRTNIGTAHMTEEVSEGIGAEVPVGTGTETVGTNVSATPDGGVVPGVEGIRPDLLEADNGVVRSHSGNLGRNEPDL